MPDRRRYLAANWKMNKTVAETRAYLEDLLSRLPATESGGQGASDVVVCPPFTALRTAAELCAQDSVRVAAQNMHEEGEGAYTGEVSAAMLLELGVEAVILGHSERRALFGERDEALARKVPAALAAGLEPILCVGETEGQRDALETEEVLAHQLVTDLAAVDADRLDRVVIAYEPVWAIGTGRTATPEQAQDAILFIRNLVRGRSEQGGERVRILYGGSVKPDNAAELLSLPDIDGALVGGASLDPADFAAIVAAGK
jgi:triosephosphate isomerase (TIM)